MEYSTFRVTLTLKVSQDCLDEFGPPVSWGWQDLLVPPTGPDSDGCVVVKVE